MLRLPRLLLWLPLALILAPAPVLAAAKATPPPPPKALNRNDLGHELRKLLDTPSLRRARFGVCAMDLAGEDWLFDHNPDELLTVASNNKLVTTAAALELLGPDFEFRTTLAALGKLQPDGLLQGDLVLIGRGDPNISGRLYGDKPTAVLEEWARAAAQAGIRSVRGGILADDSYFDQQHTHPDWPQGQYQAWYSAPVSALSFNDNCILVVVRPGPKRGDPAVATTDPPASLFELVNSCSTSRARVGNNRVIVHRRLGEDRILISGNIRHQSAPFSAWITVHNPALYTAAAFSDVLRAKGIPVSGPARLLTQPLNVQPAALREITTTTSTLKDAVIVANKNSQNFYAEQIVKTLAREKAGKGTWPAGAEIVTKFLRSAKVTGTLTYRDGSGLARTNRFSTRQIVQLLQYANGRRWGATYLHSLAEPGEEGTLSRRLDALKGRLFAKTGYISAASALSGYLETRGKRLLAFSILVNDFRCSLADVRNLQDAIVARLADYAP